MVSALASHGALSKLVAVNVLERADVRAGIKAFTEWPTVPQVFIHGKFVGGCDIILEMHRNGELAKALSSIVEP